MRSPLLPFTYIIHVLPEEFHDPRPSRRGSSSRRFFERLGAVVPPGHSGLRAAWRPSAACFARRARRHPARASRNPPERLRRARALQHRPRLVGRESPSPPGLRKAARRTRQVHRRARARAFFGFRSYTRTRRHVFVVRTFRRRGGRLAARPPFARLGATLATAAASGSRRQQQRLRPSITAPPPWSAASARRCARARPR